MTNWYACADLCAIVSGTIGSGTVSVTGCCQTSNCNQPKLSGAARFNFSIPESNFSLSSVPLIFFVVLIINRLKLLRFQYLLQ